jgi:hypothetical protein
MIRRHDTVQESKRIRGETAQLIKQVKGSGVSEQQQNKLIRDFESIMKKVLDASRDTGERPVTWGPDGPLSVLLTHSPTDQLRERYPEPTGGSGGSSSGGRPLGPSSGGGSGDSDMNTSLLQDEEDSRRSSQQSRMVNNQDQINRRENEFTNIESDVADIAEIMQDLAVIVHSQVPSDPTRRSTDSVAHARDQQR